MYCKVDRSHTMPWDLLLLQLESRKVWLVILNDNPLSSLVLTVVGKNVSNLQFFKE